MFLGQKKHLVVEEVPVAGILANRDDGNQETRCCRQVRGLKDGLRKQK